jgi:hypothetical protein
VKEISDAEMLAALLPSSPAAMEQPQTVEYQQGPAGVSIPVYVSVAGVAPAATPAATPATGTIPAWAKGVAVASVGVGGGMMLLAGALQILSVAVAAATAAVAAALPMLILAGVAVAAVAGKRGNRGVSVTQTVTQTVTNKIRIK